MAITRAGGPEFESWRMQCLLQHTESRGHTASGTHPASVQWASLALPTACRAAEVKKKWSCASVTARVIVACCRSALPLYLTIFGGHKQFETWSKIHRILCLDLASPKAPVTSAFSQIFWRQQMHCCLLLSVLYTYQLYLVEHHDITLMCAIPVVRVTN